MKELICFIMSSAKAIISRLEPFTLSCQSGSFVNLIDFMCIFNFFLVLVLSVFTTKKLLIYLPVACFNKSIIIIKDTVLFLIYGLVIFVIYWSFNGFLIILFLIMFINLIIPLFIIDNKIGYLPDVLTYPLLWLGLLYQINLPHGNVVSAIYAVIISYLVMRMVTVLVEKNTRQTQMGKGDFKLIAACAAWLGVWQLPYFLGVAAGLGLIQYWVIYGVLPIISQRGKQKQLTCLEALLRVQIDKNPNAIPFGPALMISASIWLYLSIIGY